jgi:hypothetical protein
MLHAINIINIINIIKYYVLCKAMELFIIHFFPSSRYFCSLGSKYLICHLFTNHPLSTCSFKVLTHAKKKVSPNYSVPFLPIIYVAIGQTGTNFLCVSRKLIKLTYVFNLLCVYTSWRDVFKMFVYSLKH